tara:strand:- start:3123 stop:3578 length:456 start_codon:yes stop_codon:yes gene_type:complete
MKKLVILKHYKGAPGLRILGLGPNLIPCKGLIKLKEFLNENAFWAKNRDIRNLKTCLAQSDIVVSLWLGREIVGFGRALTDGIYRGVLWDIVIDEKYQGKGYGKVIVKTLLNSKKMKATKKIYLMTTNKKDFYCQLDFKENTKQNLLIREQ